MHAPDAADWAFGRTVVSARKPRLRPPALAPLLLRRREPQPAAAPATDHQAISCRRALLRRAIHDTKVLIQSPHDALTISVRQCRSHLVCARSRLRWDCLGMCRIGVEVVHLLSAGLNLWFVRHFVQVLKLGFGCFSVHFSCYKLSSQIRVEGIN